MAEEHLNILLKKAGFDEADVKAVLELPDDTEEFNPNDYVGKLKTNFETQIKNDPKFWESLDENNVHENFRKKIEAQQYGRASNIVRQKALKGLGLKEEDLSDLPADEKKQLEPFITKAIEKFTSTKTSDKQLQQQLVEARKRLEELEQEIPEKSEKLKKEYETRYNNEKLDFIILAELGKVEGLKVPATYLANNLAAELKDEFQFDIQGLKAIPKQKENPNLDVIEGTKVQTLTDIIVKKLTKDNLIEDKKVTVQKGVLNVDVQPDGKGGMGISGHVLEKIKASNPSAEI